MFRRHCTAALLALATTGTWGQVAAPAAAPVTTLRQAFDAAWARQPEARSHGARQKAALARRESASSWTAEPPSLELSGKTDQLNRDDGSREYEVGVAVPLWLPGERPAIGALADAELRANVSHTLAARLRTAAAVRAAYWDWQRARIDVAVARERLASARELTADVAKRVRAGDLARADGHQAEGALASAEASLAEAGNALATAAQQLRAQTGIAPAVPLEGGVTSEPEPSLPVATAALDAGHPAMTELLDRAEVARRTVTLAAAQRRANPELSVAAMREREAASESWQQTVTLGLRIPFGADSRSRSKVAGANAEAIEAEAQLALERERLFAEVDAAKVHVEAAHAQVAAAERRARLARESREFFHKAFRLGETDLPTRLRIELEAAEAERQLARARVELAAAVSAQRQTMGLLPE